MTNAAPHRTWLHALEDSACPDYALQVARVYADFAASAPAEPVHVSWRMLARTTHQHNDKLSKSLRWLTDHGWLGSLPRENGQRLYRRLTTPDVQSAVAVSTTPDGRSRTTPDGRSRTTPDGRSTNVPTSITDIRDRRFARSRMAPRSARGAG